MNAPRPTARVTGPSSVRRFPLRKALAFVILVVLSLFVLVVLTALDPFGGNVALTAALEAGLIALLAYLLTFVAVPRRRRQRSED
jgi:hypothetical protein